MPLDKAEEQSKSDLMERAKKELEDWYKQHEEQVAKTRQANRYVSVLDDIGTVFRSRYRWWRIVLIDTSTLVG